MRASLNLKRIAMLLGAYSVVATAAASSPEIHGDRDVFSDSSFTMLGRWAWGPCYAADVKKDLAFIGNGPTLHVLDISRPDSPWIAAEYVTGGIIRDIKIQDTLAFVCDGVGLVIVSVVNPLSPMKIGELPIPGSLRVVPTDSFAYVTHFGLVSIVDIIDPTNPFSRAVVPAGGNIPAALAVHDRYLFVGNPEWPDLRFLDAHNPDTVKNLGYVNLGGWGISATVHDTLLLAGVSEYDGTQSLKLYNVQDATRPIELGRLPVGFTRFYEIDGIGTDGKYAFLAIGGHGIKAVDISQPRQPKLVDSLYSTELEHAVGSTVVFVDSTLYAPFMVGLWAVDFSNTGALRERSLFTTGGYANSIYLDDSIAFVASGFAGLWILDVSNPQRPRPLSNVNTGGFTTDVVASESIAYIVNYSIDSSSYEARGLWVIDISNRNRPEVISHHSGITGFAQSYAFANSITKYGNLIFLTQSGAIGNDSTLEIIDVSNDSSPVSLGVFRSLYSPYFVSVSDTLAYLATPDGGLRIITWKDPTRPVEISSILDAAIGAVASDSIVYVDRGDAMFVVSVSNPASPYIMSSLLRDIGGFTGSRLFVDGHFLYWAGADYFGIFDVSDPTRPRDISHQRTGATSIAANGPMLYYTEGFGGVWILKNNLVTTVQEAPAAASRFEVYQNHPNPFNPRTTIEFYNPRRQNVEIQVYDLLGCRVRSVLDETVEAGYHGFLLDGSSLASGVYFYLVKTAHESITKKMIIVR